MHRPIPVKTTEKHSRGNGRVRDAANDEQDGYATNETPFGKILRGEIPASILAESDEYLAFQDKCPGAPLHGLVIPKRRIHSVIELSSADLTMLYQMKDMSKQIVKEYYPASHDDYELLFHIPPFYSVKHLHLHVLAPVSEMTWFYRKFKFPSHETYWCTSLDHVIHRLEQGKSPVQDNCFMKYFYKRW